MPLVAVTYPERLSRSRPYKLRTKFLPRFLNFVKIVIVSIVLLNHNTCYDVRISRKQSINYKLQFAYLYIFTGSGCKCFLNLIYSFSFVQEVIAAAR